MMSKFHTRLNVLFFLAALSLVVSCDKDEKDDPPPPAVNLNPGPCDNNLNLVVTDVFHMFKAIDICKISSGSGDGGLVTASFIRASDAEIAPNTQYGIMGSFGTNNVPKKGSNMLVMSTGRARTPAQPNSCGSTTCIGTGTGSAPIGIPSAVPGCPTPGNIYDDVGIKLTLRVPESATGFSIDHNFFTFDFPELVCTAFNDQFVIVVDPAPSGAIGGNVAFDDLSKPIGVNSQFIQGNNSSLLVQTGFDTWGDAAATGWLRTTVPVSAGSIITIRLLIFGAGDQASDSSVLIDNFLWHTGTVTLKTQKL